MFHQCCHPIPTQFTSFIHVVKFFKNNDYRKNMKLLTHNMMQSHVKGISKRFPLLIKPGEVRVVEQDFNPDFIRRMITRIEWAALQAAMEWCGHAGKLPAEAPTDEENDEELLKAVHHALVEIEVIEGHLECPESGRQFPIKNGIPNMLLNEDEV